MTNLPKKQGIQPQKIERVLKTARVLIDPEQIDPGRRALEPASQAAIQPTSSHKSLQQQRFKNPSAGKLFGVYPAIVTDNQDPDNQGRVMVALPWLSWGGGGDGAKRGGYWARLATLMAGNNRGSWFIPDVDDEVLVAFEGGDPSHPYVIGSLWNGQDAPPAQMDGAGSNNHKVLRSRNGVTVTLDDADGKERLLLETPGGQSIALADQGDSVKIADSNGNSITFSSSGITINVSAKLIVNAATIQASAGMINVDAGMSKFSGAVKCDSIIAKNVIGESYTPGAGNAW